MNVNLPSNNRTNTHTLSSIETNMADRSRVSHCHYLSSFLSSTQLQYRMYKWGRTAHAAFSPSLYITFMALVAQVCERGMEWRFLSQSRATMKAALNLEEFQSIFSGTLELILSAPRWPKIGAVFFCRCWYLAKILDGKPVGNFHQRCYLGSR